MKSQEKKLRTVLIINAAFTFTSALLFITRSKQVANVMSIENTIVLPSIGIGLILFFLLLIYNGTKKELSLKQIKSIIYQDWSWVVGSIIIIVINPFNISLAGNVSIAFVAIIVGIFGLIQYHFVRLLKRNN